MSTEEELECEFIKQYPDLYYEGGKNIFNFIRTNYIPRGEVEKMLNKDGRYSDKEVLEATSAIINSL